MSSKESPYVQRKIVSIKDRDKKDGHKIAITKQAVEDKLIEAFNSFKVLQEGDNISIKLFSDFRLPIISKNANYGTNT